MIFCRRIFAWDVIAPANRVHDFTSSLLEAGTLLPGILLQIGRLFVVPDRMWP